jgi:hypothetical protein
LRKSHEVDVQCQGHTPFLTGEGLVRSAGGWEGVKALGEERVYQRNDERILGRDFVERVLASAPMRRWKSVMRSDRQVLKR